MVQFELAKYQAVFESDRCDTESDLEVRPRQLRNVVLYVSAEEKTGHDFTRLKQAGSLKDDCASPRGMTKFWSTGSHQIGLISISRRTSEVSKTKLRSYRWPEHS